MMNSSDVSKTIRQALADYSPPMNQPTDLAAVRAAAEEILEFVTKARLLRERANIPLATFETVANHTLQTIPADATAPIDAAWLREAWGWRSNGTMSMHYDCDERMALCWSDDGVSFVAKTVGMRVYTKGFPITTRHQFTQLAACLGIQPQPPKAKE